MKQNILVLCMMALAAASWTSPTYADTLSAASRIEIESLLSKLRASGCVFNRNGNWYSSEEAQKHLSRKLEYLVEKKAVASAEQYIGRAASKSSMTGQSYLVKCDDKPPVPSEKWLYIQLQEMRAVSPGSASKAW